MHLLLQYRVAIPVLSLPEEDQGQVMIKLLSETSVPVTLVFV